MRVIANAEVWGLRVKIGIFNILCEPAKTAMPRVKECFLSTLRQEVYVTLVVRSTETGGYSRVNVVTGYPNLNVETQIRRFSLHFERLHLRSCRAKKSTIRPANACPVVVATYLVAFLTYVC